MHIPIISTFLKPIRHLTSIVSHHKATRVVVTFVSHNVIAVSVAGAIVVGSGAIGLVSFVNQINSKSDAAQSQPNSTTDIEKTDTDTTPTILVKDPETGKTRQVSQSDIKKDPSLINDVIKTPSANDYQNAGISQPLNQAIYDCIETISGDPKYEVQLTQSSGMGLNDPNYCKTITKQVSPPTSSQPEVIYSHSTQTYINGNTTIESSMFDSLSDGNGGKLCNGTGTRLPYGNYYFIGGSDIVEPSRQFDNNCQRYDYVNSGNGLYEASNGQSAYGLYTLYAKFQYQPITFTYQTRKISCTIHTHQTNLIDKNTGEYFDRDYDISYGFTDTYPISSVGYAGEDPCSFLRNNCTMTRVSIYAAYDANNSWTIATSFFGIDALNSD